MGAEVLPISEYRRKRNGPELATGAQIPGAIVNSPQMAYVAECLTRIAPHYRTVLVTGETGTGKEVVARAIHDLSPVTGRFVTVNCSAIVETLFESELFGHVRGAFTGAERDKVGQFEFAHGGTLLLDEVGDMPLSTQAKLLRVLQSQEIQRVGSLSTKQVDVRVIAATNKDLRAAVAKKEFREDLYYRLAMVEVHLPALRDRVGDLGPMTEFFLKQWSARYERSIRRLSSQAAAIFARHRWPGNVRELENVLGYACMMAAGEQIELEDLPSYLTEVPESSLEPLREQLDAEGTGAKGPGVLEKCESWLLRQALDRANWNQTKAAQALGTTRDRLRYRIKKYHLMRSEIAGEDSTYG